MDIGRNNPAAPLTHGLLSECRTFHRSSLPRPGDKCCHVNHIVNVHSSRSFSARMVRSAHFLHLSSPNNNLLGGQEKGGIRTGRQHRETAFPKTDRSHLFADDTSSVSSVHEKARTRCLPPIFPQNCKPLWRNIPSCPLQKLPPMARPLPAGVS